MAVKRGQRPRLKIALCLGNYRIHLREYKMNFPIALYGVYYLDSKLNRVHGYGFETESKPEVISVH